jgi:hypothetical protein
MTLRMVAALAPRRLDVFTSVHPETMVFGKVNGVYSGGPIKQAGTPMLQGFETTKWIS